MQIIALNDKCQHATPSGAVKKVPKDWIGEFPETDALREIAAGNARQVGVTSAAELRPDQVAVLAAAADSIIVQAQNEAIERLMSSDLKAMEVDELKQLAASLGVEIAAGAKKKGIITALEGVRDSLAESAQAGGKADQ